jgi:hypothetical protein
LTMTLLYDSAAVTERMRKLTTRQLVTFGAGCSERLLPAYQAFARMEKWGDRKTMRSGIDAVWAWVLDDGIDLASFLPRVEACAPDSEDFDSLFVGPAINAVGALYNTVLCSIDGDLKWAVGAGNIAFDAMYSYIKRVNDPRPGGHGPDSQLDLYVASSPLLLGEIERQLREIDLLQACTSLDESFLTAYKIAAATGGIAPVERGMVSMPDGYEPR